MRIPRQVTPGPGRHGVVRFARELAGALHAAGAREADAHGVHVHFTDRIWGADPEAAAARVEELASRRPLTVTLHDLPQASDGAGHARRRACYARVAGAARAVAVSSAHEAALLRAVRPDAAPAVIPLPVMLRPDPGVRATPDDEVALLGFFYPGKGHAEAVAAVAALGGAGGRPLGVTALGAASPGHEDELAALQDDAARRGVRFRATGYLSEPALLAACRRAAVPLAAHRSVSASGSVGSWIGAGRRPLVPDGPYGREVAALRPGTVTLYAPGALPAAILRAREDPASTWWAPDATTGPGLPEVAAAYAAWWAAA